MDPPVCRLFLASSMSLKTAGVLVTGAMFAQIVGFSTNHWRQHTDLDLTCTYIFTWTQFACNMLVITFNKIMSTSILFGRLFVKSRVSCYHCILGWYIKAITNKTWTMLFDWGLVHLNVLVVLSVWVYYSCDSFRQISFNRSLANRIIRW